jgi:hypothetical protein
MARSITADTDLRLGRYFGLSEEAIGCAAKYADTEVAKALGRCIEKNPPAGTDCRVMK